MSTTRALQAGGPRLQPLSAWAGEPVSRWSRFGDDVWKLDIEVAGRRADQKWLRWDAPMADGSRLTDPQHAGLLRAAKQFLWSMRLDPPNGRKRASSSTIYSRAIQLIVLARWMATEGYASFGALDPAAVERLRAWLLARPGRRPRRSLAPTTLAHYLILLKDLYRQRAKLEDALGFDPLPTETTFEAAGVTRSSKGAIPFIPDAIAVDLLAKALAWVERHAEAILTARDIRGKAYVSALARGGGRDDAARAARRVLRRAALASPSGDLILGAFDVKHLIAHLAEACFVVIAGFVGMRVSEILSIRAGAIEQRPMGETGLSQAYLVARLYKTVDEPGGRIERWLAPEPVVRAIAVLERLSAPLREASGRDELFLVKNTQYGEIVPVTGMHIGFRVREFAEHVGVPYHEGRPWPFSPHQFRKTFARFVARRDRSQLMALADHFKHASVVMTAKGYVGSDFDLHELVAHEARVETALALERFLASDRLAGRMGERISAGNQAFRGRAGGQVRRDYVAFVLAETDLAIHACDYGWCVFQRETARCGGQAAPSETGRSPSVCLACANFVVDRRHRDYWRDRRARNAALLEGAGRLSRAVLEEAIDECDRVLRIVGDEDDGPPRS